MDYDFTSDSRAELRDLQKDIEAELRARDKPSVTERKKAAAARKRAELPDLRDRRRFKFGPVANGTIKSLAPAGVTGTVFRSMVRDPIEDHRAILKDGKHSCKIGGQVLVGPLKGAKILTLTLEERATCPRACPLWRGCYGNSMPRSTRWKAGPALLDRLALEVDAACSNNERVLIRLHVLGDFFSFGYVRFWGNMLDMYANLTIFGFTAWQPNTEIGNGLAQLRQAYPHRFMVRHSERTGEWGAFTVDFPTEERYIGDALVCPEQRDANAGGKKQVHCGSCGACWLDARPIVFIRH